MLRSGVGLAGLVLAAGLGPGVTFGWSADTRLRMVDDAVRLTPPAFALILARHRDDCRSGALESSGGESGPEHALVAGGKGKLDDVLAQQVEDTIGALVRHEPMRLVCHRAGVISHIIADLNHPLHTGGERLRSSDYYEEFDAYAADVASPAPPVFQRR